MFATVRKFQIYCFVGLFQLWWADMY